MKSFKDWLFLAVSICTSLVVQAQDLYFPPLSGDTWNQIPIANAGYCQTGIETLDSLLEAQNSKAFILLKDGKIVHEKYFDAFTKDSLWQWNSAGKTITATLIGIAAQENLLAIEDLTSTYLGTGWTAAPISKENAITIRHQLTMTTGLDDAGSDPFCTEPSCLTYLADAGTRWSYHNGPYTLLDEVLEAASGQTTNAYFQTRIRRKTGITGLFLSIGFNNVFFSTPRSMARFGLLALNNGTWDNESILTNTAFSDQMTSSSQDINPAYGYLWWLNGTPRHRLPGTQLDFPGSIAPSAPGDAYAGLGKDGQIVAVLPSTNEVWIRMGDAPTGASQLVSNQVFEEISQAIENARCTISNNTEILPKKNLKIKTNPANNYIELRNTKTLVNLEIFDSNGRQVIYKTTNFQSPIDISHLAKGQYVVIGRNSTGRGEFATFTKL